MARTLDRSKHFGEVFGDDPNIKHRYFQHGMLFDEQGNLVGPEKPVPADAETEEQMRARLTKEIREQVEKEHREKMAESAKSGGGDVEAANKNARPAPQRNAGNGDDGDDLPGNLGKDGKKK